MIHAMTLRIFLVALPLLGFALACAAPCGPGTYNEDGVCFPLGSTDTADTGSGADPSDTGDSGDV